MDQRVFQPEVSYSGHCLKVKIEVAVIFFSFQNAKNWFFMSYIYVLVRLKISSIKICLAPKVIHFKLVPSSGVLLQF